MVPPRRVAPRLATRTAGGGRGVRRAPFHEGKGALARGRAVEGPRPTRIGGGRVHVGAWRPHARPGRAVCAGLGASSRPAAGSLAPATERKDGDLRVRSAPPARVGAERGPHPAPTEAAGAGRPGLRTVRPGPSHRPGSAGPAASVRVPRRGRARRARRGPGAAGSRGPGLTSVPIAGRSVPGRGTTIGGAAARGGTAAAAAPAARRAGGAGAAAWAARRPELAPRCRRSRWRAQPARPPTGFLH